MKRFTFLTFNHQNLIWKAVNLKKALGFLTQMNSVQKSNTKANTKSLTNLIWLILLINLVLLDSSERIENWAGKCCGGMRISYNSLSDGENGSIVWYEHCYMYCNYAIRPESLFIQ